MPRPETSIAGIPMRTVGPLRIVGIDAPHEVKVPLATYESPLWYTTQRGARISMLTEGIHTVLVAETMSRSIVLEGPDAATVSQINHLLLQEQAHFATIVANTSRFAQFKSCHTQQVGKLLYLRVEITCGDAAGHNMVTKAAEAVLNWILERHKPLRYISLSANYCTDKKVSAVNGIMGRGKYVVAEMIVPEAICEERLRVTPSALVELNIKKNLLGSTLAGSLRSANAHFANILLAIYLATGQDAANIIEGSQGITHTELKDKDLYFSVTLPNIIVGTKGNGKELDFVQKNLELLGCTKENNPGNNAKRLALIIAAAVWCGELSLLAALANPGELMKSHLKLERCK